MTANPPWVLNSSRKYCYTPLFSSLSKKIISVFFLLKCTARPSHSLSHNCWLCLMLLWETKRHEKGIAMSSPNNSGSRPTSLSMLPVLYPVTKGDSYCTCIVQTNFHPSPLLEKFACSNHFFPASQRLCSKAAHHIETCSIHCLL